MRLESIFQENDAVNCYNRIIPAMTCALTRRLGANKQMTSYQTKILENFEHHIRVMTGPSERYFTYKQDYPIYGTGQGTGWSPMIWTAFNDVIINAMATNCIKIKYNNPDNTITSEQNADAFVDDRAIGATSNMIPEGQLLIEEMQKVSQKYERYLYVSGGKLAIQKCAYRHIDFKRTKRGAIKYKTIAETPDRKIVLNEGFTNDTLEIKRKEYDQAYKTLGFFAAPDGNRKQEIEYLQEKTIKWSMHINANSL